MKKGNKLLTAVLALVLCLGIVMPAPAGAATPIFVAINDRVLEATAETMPIWVGDEMYIPYSALDANTNGVRWGIYCSYIKTDHTLSVFDADKRKFLEFDLREGTSFNALTGEPCDGGAILRGSRPYLPLEMVCDFFGLESSYHSVNQGKLLRIRSDEAVLTDVRFLDAAVNVLDMRLKEYNQANGIETPAPAPANPGTPSGGTAQVEKRVPTYLAFTCKSAEDLATLLLSLENSGIHAVIFLTPELIRERGDLVFWISGAGHTVGLTAAGADPAEITRSLEEGNRALAEEAFLRTDVVRAPAEYLGWLEEEGWVCWNSTLEPVPTDKEGAVSFAGRVLSRLQGRTRATYLLLESSGNTLRVLPTMLKVLEEAGFVPDLPLETRL